MEQSNPPDADQDALKRLQTRLDRASGAAERLIAEAGRAAQSRKPPAAGWQAPRDDGSAGTPDGDLEVLVALMHSLRDLIPPELQRRVGEALRELLLALRALIDWYLERAEKQRAAPVEVQDIPIL